MMPGTVSTGQQITVIMNVTNNGTGNVNAVTAAIISTGWTGIISVVSTPGACEPEHSGNWVCDIYMGVQRDSARDSICKRERDRV